mmetsp:Transcript_13258/g.31240  ORF Transcript_13258/g.31240 Transcript_13258/m.31240 type:complete len:213 (+) Transcript_13258:396-1034(+)
MLSPSSSKKRTLPRSVTTGEHRPCSSCSMRGLPSATLVPSRAPIAAGVTMSSGGKAGPPWSRKISCMYSCTTSARPKEAMPTATPRLRAVETNWMKRSLSAMSRSQRAATCSGSIRRPKAWMRSTVLSKSQTTSEHGGPVGGPVSHSSIMPESWTGLLRALWPRACDCTRVAASWSAGSGCGLLPGRLSGGTSGGIIGGMISWRALLVRRAG